MIRITDDLLNELSAKARSSPRLRMNHNFHTSPDDKLQRMLNAMEPGTYIRPHKHENPDKREAFLALRGTLCVIEFNDLGEITDHTILSANRRNYGAEIAERSWHSVISLESGSVAYEVKDGPYNPLDDKDFAPWSPVEGSEGAESYLQQLIKQLGLSVS